MPEGEIVRELLSDKVYSLIRASILDGTRQPGSRIVESEIARRLAVSQAPVREAVKRLVLEGLASSEPRRGSYVTEVSPQEFVIARQMRAALESIGAGNAIAHLADRDVERLEAIVQKMDAAIAVGDWAEFRTLDMDFHGYVLTIGGHQILSRLWSTLEPLLVSQRVIGDPAYPGDRAAVVSWHSDLIDVLKSGDVSAASSLFSAHAAGELLPAR